LIKGVVDGPFFPIANFMLPVFYRQNGSRYLDVVYVSYSPALHSEAMIEAGKTFLSSQVAQAFTGLREKQVKSQAYSAKLATDTMSENFIKCLLINEHADPGWMLSTKEKGRWVAERFLILLVENGERAFHFSDAKTGAAALRRSCRKPMPIY
jgi:hypothetical protein